MDHDSHKGAIERSVELGNYTGLVSAVLAQVSAGLEDHKNDGDVQGPAAKRLKQLSTSIGAQTPAQRAMAGHFALGADDLMYLQNAVSVLAAGHEGGSDEIPIAPGEMLGANVVESVRRLVEADMRTREIGRLAEAPARLHKLATTVAWLLKLEEVRNACLPTCETLIVVASPTPPGGAAGAAGGAACTEAASTVAATGGEYDAEATATKIKDALRTGTSVSMRAFGQLLMHLYSMLSDKFAPGMVASEVEGAMRKSVGDFESARKDHRQRGFRLVDDRLVDEENKTLLESLVVLQADISELEKQLNQHSDSLKRLEAEKQDLTNTNMTIVGQRDSLRAELDTEKDALERLFTEFVRRGNDLEVLESKIFEQAVTIKKQTERIAPGDVDVSRLQSTIVEQVERIQEQERKLRELQERLAEKAIEDVQEASPPNPGRYSDSILKRLGRLLEGANLSEDEAREAPKAGAVGAPFEIDDRIYRLLLHTRAQLPETTGGRVNPAGLSVNNEDLNLIYADKDEKTTVAPTPLPSEVLRYTRKILADHVAPDVSHTGDALVRYAEYRGLVGQRGPEEPEDTPGGGLLKYAAPWSNGDVGPGDLLSLDKQREHREMANVPLPNATREQTAELFKGASVSDTLGVFAGDYAMIPAPKNATIEQTFRARWRPKGPTAGAIARAAALEHATVRCVAFASADSTEPDRKLFQAAAGALKLRQLEPLLAVHMQIESSGGESLSVLPPDNNWVTRPLAPMRSAGNKLCYPIDAGLKPIPEPAIAPENQIALADWLDQKALGEKRYTFRGMSKALQELARPDDAREGPPPAVYIAPEVGRLAYGVLPRRPSGGVVEFAKKAFAKKIKGDVENDLKTITESSQLSVARLRGLFRAGLADVEALTSNAPGKDPAAHHSTGRLPFDPTLPPPPGTAAAVRGGLWKEMLRGLAISNDRLWIFVRTLSGCIGEDASSLLSTADEETQRAQRAVEAERKAVAERVASFQSKIVEILVANLLRTSKLEVLPDKRNEALMVIDGEAAKQMRDLASGESGRPFFEANVAMQNMLDQSANKELPLAKLVQDFNSIVTSVHTSLSRELEQGLGANGSVAQLAEARNSYFVSLRPDVCAAIRSAVDRFHHEIGSQRPCLWELVEGASPSLSLRFAELVGHVLVQTRNSTGASALYVSAAQQAQTAAQARMGLLRLSSEAQHYLASAPVPNFADDQGRDKYFKSSPGNLGGVGRVR